MGGAWEANNKTLIRKNIFFLKDPTTKITDLAV